jgi:hypothetical protein
MGAAKPQKSLDTEVIPPVGFSLGAAAPIVRWAPPLVFLGGLTSASAQASGAERRLRGGRRYFRVGGVD